MTEQARRVRVAIAIAVALVCALVLGVLVLAGGDWLPGMIIVVAAAIGLGRQVATINNLRRGPGTPTNTSS